MHDAPSIDGNTKIMGLIGSPVTQVKTPQAINPIFAEAGANILCVPIHVDDLETAMAGFRAMHNLIGFGVTLPHKQQIASLCDSLDPPNRSKRSMWCAANATAAFVAISLTGAVLSVG